MKLAWRLSCVVLHILTGLFICLCVFPWIGPARRMGHIKRWSRGVLRTFGITVETGGETVPEQVLLVANHISWVDVFVINACFPSRFVAKSEVRRWPLIGLLAKLAGTVFVARGSGADLKRTVGALAASLHGGERIACFPEGTSAAQGDMQPFRANLFEAALLARTPVQAVALSYLDDGGAAHPSVEYIATTSLAESMVAILTGPPVRARLCVMAPLEGAGMPRRALAQAAEAQIRGALAALGSAAA